MQANQIGETTMPADDPGTSHPTGPQAALEALAAALDSREFATALTASPGRRPCLAVTNRHAALGDNIYADTR
jgi:hypothetical protein